MCRDSDVLYQKNFSRTYLLGAYIMRAFCFRMYIDVLNYIYVQRALDKSKFKSFAHIGKEPSPSKSVFSPFSIAPDSRD